MFPLNVEEKKEQPVKKVNPIIQKILNFENGFVGIIIIILIGIIGLLVYDIKNSIPQRDEMIYLIVLGVLSLYHIFDFVFRNIFLEKSVGSSYFKLQTFSVITLLTVEILVIDGIIFLLS